MQFIDKKIEKYYHLKEKYIDKTLRYRENNPDYQYKNKLATEKYYDAHQDERNRKLRDKRAKQKEARLENYKKFGLDKP